VLAVVHKANVAPVSVVVPCYRCAATLVRAVESVAAQTQRPAELILVDDCSGDATRPLLHAIQARYGPWVRLVELPVNAGAASARNAGWQLAIQDYVAFLDSDDAWHPRKIEIQYGYMQSHPEVALCGHQCRQLEPGLNDASWWSLNAVNEAKTVTLLGLLLRHAFVTPSVMLKRNIAMRFAKGARHMEDHRLWVDIVGAQLLTVKLQVELVAVYKPVYGAAGLSADMWPMERAELENYRYFHGAGKISYGLMRLLQAYSLAKYLRRLVIVHVLRRTGY
jgi:glycosyltransferase involved in cell wall biosynthesis